MDVLVMGGGQVGLAAGYHLHRLARDAARGRGGPAPSFAILDAADGPGGAWSRYWDSLALFSPAETSSLPGWRMPAWQGPGTPSADLAPVARSLTWATRRPPRWMPDDVDGAALFRAATARVRTLTDPGAQDGPDGEREQAGVGALGDIVVLPPVRRARDAGLLAARPMPERLTADGAVWADGSHEPRDAVVWCTGFRPALGHLRPLGLTRRGDVPATAEDPPTASADRPGLFLLGYGDWCGPASATLVGVGAPARATVAAAAAQVRAAAG